MERTIVNYFYIVAAFMLMLDSTISFFHVVSVLIFLSICLRQHLRFDSKDDGYLTVLRSVCRTE